MPAHPAPGFSLVEVLVALLLLESAGALLLVAVLGSERLAREAAAREAVDVARRDSVLALASAASCLAAPHPDSQVVRLPAAPGRPALRVTIRCGR